MNKHPLNAVTDQLKADYERDGVVCVRGMFDQEWVENLHKAAEAAIAAPADHGNLGLLHGEMTSINFLYRRPGAFRDFVLGSPAAEVMARIIGSDTLRMHHDYVFSKEPGCAKVVPWHADGITYSIKGWMMPNLWISLTGADATNGRLEFIGGFYREYVEGRRDANFNHGAILPDFEAELQNPDCPYRRLTWDLEPGDAVMFHPFTPHHSKANTSADKRRTGYAMRCIGDDIRWHKERRNWLDIDGLDFDAVVDGAPVTENDAFPLLWQAD